MNAEKSVTARLSVLSEGRTAVTRPAGVTNRGVSGGRPYTRTVHAGPDGHTVAETWLLHGAGHAWSGGNPAGSYTTTGPDASAEMVRFFGKHTQPLPAA